MLLLFYYKKKTKKKISQNNYGTVTHPGKENEENYFYLNIIERS